MVQIDMEMPSSCNSCYFFMQVQLGILRKQDVMCYLGALLDKDNLWRRQKDCPLVEIKNDSD